MTDAAAHRSKFAYWRLGIACVLSLTALPWLSGKAFISLLVGHLLWVETLGWVVCTAAVLVAVFRLGCDDRIWRWRWPLAIGLPVLWMTIKAVALLLNLSPLSPWQTSLLVTTTTLYTLWIPWMFFRPWSPAVRGAVLVLLIALSAPYWLLIEFKGLTGELGLHYAWRQWKPDAALLTSGTAADGGTVEPGRDETADVNVDPLHDYPQFLGPAGNGVLSDTNLSSEWRTSPPELKWRRDVGPGWSGVAVAAGRLWTQEQRGSDECVSCYRLEDGAPLWVYSYAADFDSPMGGAGPRATPTIANKRVYTLGATGLLHCLHAATGKRIWQADTLDGRKSMYHGEANSPLYVASKSGDMIVAAPTGEGGPSLIAYDAATGAVRWKSSEGRASYSSPAVAEICGKRQLLLFGGGSICGFDLNTGVTLWRRAWANRVETAVAQPLVHVGGKDRVFVSCGYGKGSLMLQLSQQADGGFRVKELWTSKDMKNKFCSSAPLDGFIYGMDDGILACINAASGRRQWKRGRYGHGQILLAGRLLLVQCENGDIALLRPTPEGPGEIARLPALNGKTWNHPALSDGMLVVRNSAQMACYRLPTNVQATRTQPEETPGGG